MDFIEKINLKNFKNSPLEQLFLENNEKQINSICDFLNGDSKLFLVNGFLGAGKTAFVDFIIQNVNENVLTMKYTCCETSVLDDMLLSLFESFRNFAINGIISLPKSKVDNFAQKINACFNSVSQKPVLIFLDSFSAVLKANKREIIDFIKHLSKYDNIKFIISSRVFDYDEFEPLKYETATITPFSKDYFEKFLRANNIKNIGVLSNELYKQTRGYFLYANLSVKLMEIHGFNLGRFLEIFSKSSMSFTDFVLREALMLVDPVSLHLFRLLALMRIPIRKNLLKTFNIYNEEQVNFFLNNSLLASDGDFLYLPDYFREIIEHQIQDNVIIKLHKSCVELYETQLPLKPAERDLRLSRRTMRNEIEYHSMFLPKKPVIIQNVEPAKQGVQPEENQKIEEKTETKEEKIKKINFIIEDEAILDNIADSIKNFVNYKTKQKEFFAKTSILKLNQLLNSAHKCEAEFDYKSAAILYQTALTKKDDPDFDTLLPKIYTKLAAVYKNMSQNYEAIEYYTKAQDWYFNVSDNLKVNEIKLEIANIYFEIYKYDNAEYILNSLANSPDLTNELRIKTNLLLGKMCENTDKEFDLYKKSLEFADNSVDKSVRIELYYRFAAACDEKNDTANAVIYYKKCVDIDANPSTNKFLSECYSNIALIYDEAGQSEAAVNYYLKSISVDSLNKNYNGLYTASRNLSEIYASKDEKKSLEYLQKASEFAKELNEPFYKSDTELEIANFYLLRGDFENSYKYLNKAYESAISLLSPAYCAEITRKINYVKAKL